MLGLNAFTRSNNIRGLKRRSSEDQLKLPKEIKMYFRTIQILRNYFKPNLEGGNIILNEDGLDLLEAPLAVLRLLGQVVHLGRQSPSQY